MVVRIIEGTGRGQERAISSNDQTTLTTTANWSIVPDVTSRFVVAETSWKFAAVSATSPAQFEIPYRGGTTIQISGRGANVNDQEGTADLCPITRWALGQEVSDIGVPPAPQFSLAAPGGGELMVYEVGFGDLTNTSSITSGTLQLLSWNELTDPSAYILTASLQIDDTVVRLAALPSPFRNNTIQIGSELMTILSTDAVGQTYSVLRGALGSQISSHNAGDAVLHLDSTVVIVPFAADFFENRASVNFLHTFTLPDVRISAAEFYVTNAFGDSQTQTRCYTGDPNGGLRTLSGGQFSLQISGYLATQQNAAPPLLVEASHAIRDVRATLSQAAIGYNVVVDILQSGTEYCSLSIDSGTTASTVLGGGNLPALLEGVALTVNVTLEVIPGFASSVSPGRDLTVTIRL
jgi:hypothetical protein